MIIRFICLVLLSFTLLTGKAQAQEYAKASWVNMIRTLVRFNAINFSDQKLLDEYVIISECELYRAFYEDDFKWNRVRQAVRDSIKMNIATYPANYFHDLTLRLDRYDFEAKLFRFDAESLMRGVNSYLLFSVRGTGCGSAAVEYLPRSFRVVLSSPVYLDGLPLSDGDARALLLRMNQNNNPNRVIFVRFNFRTVYIEPLNKIEREAIEGIRVQYSQAKAASSGEVRIDAQLDSVGFYEDQERTKLIYLFTP